VFFALLLQGFWSQAQQLTIQNEAGKQTVLTRADLDPLPHIKLTTGTSAATTTYEGVNLRAVLEKAGIGFGDTMKGKRLASCLLVEAADGYSVVFALPEIDPAFNDKQIVLAFSKDGKPLDDKEGPYRIVIPEEKRLARWVRQVTTLKIADVR
jgi:hypothetical protein